MTTDTSNLTDKEIDLLYEEACLSYDDECYEAAFEKYLILADAGHTNCQAIVGWMYQKGLGTEQNLFSAKCCYQKAVDANYDEGRYYLAKLLMKEKNYENAVSLLKEAATQNYLPATFYLGHIHYHGIGVEKNIKLASDYFIDAARRGHILAKRDLAAIKRKGYYGLWGRIVGYFDVLKILYLAVKLGLQDPYDDRLRE